jgi:ParB-like chromosome segregation protein Spo0J
MEANMQDNPSERLLGEGSLFHPDESGELRELSESAEKEASGMGSIPPAWTKEHPVSSVLWVPADLVYANDYNPNQVAPPEMKLLRISIETNGYTQPIVVWQTDDGYEVVDGFHRHKIGKELGLSHLPVVVINNKDTGRNDRIAATIRHNRARGKHQVQAMSDIVIELSRRNWSDKRIAKELGMDADEVLRLKQITGLAEMFADEKFSDAWE